MLFPVSSLLSTCSEWARRRGAVGPLVNSIIHNCTDLVELKYSIQDKLKHITNYTNILLASVPYKLDCPNINWTIKRCNNKLETLANCLVLHVLDSLNRSSYTRHGLHLNSYGKLICSSKQTIDNVNRKCKTLSRYNYWKNTFFWQNVLFKNKIKILDSWLNPDLWLINSFVMQVHYKTFILHCVPDGNTVWGDFTWRLWKRLDVRR